MHEVECGFLGSVLSSRCSVPPCNRSSGSHHSSSIRSSYFPSSSASFFLPLVHAAISSTPLHSSLDHVHHPSTPSLPPLNPLNALPSPLSSLISSASNFPLRLNAFVFCFSSFVSSTSSNPPLLRNPPASPHSNFFIFNPPFSYVVLPLNLLIFPHYLIFQEFLDGHPIPPPLQL